MPNDKDKAVSERMRYNVVSLYKYNSAIRNPNEEEIDKFLSALEVILDSMDAEDDNS